jgi:4-hydroxythreonine-4-phosphate dehydrogenase
LLGLDVELKTFQTELTPQKHSPGSLLIMPVGLSSPVVCGQMDAANASYVLESIRTASLACLSGQFDAMVTGPVNKAIIREAGYDFTGHTEFIAELCDKSVPVMLLANEKMRVALVTTHIPLAKVSQHITEDTLIKVIKIAAAELSSRFDIAEPRLLVCGLNPHAGENGHFGDEEVTTIIPALNKLRECGLQIVGPVPADTAYTEEALGNADLIVAMYHDQGLPALKSHGFGETVNITLGLPIIRTSVDHGTALALAGSGQASARSLICAIDWAINLANNERAAAHVKVNPAS